MRTNPTHRVVVTGMGAITPLGNSVPAFWEGLTAGHSGVRLATHCMGQVRAATYRRALECIVTFDRSGNLGNIRVPTLLVAGEHDRNAPPGVMKKMADRIAHSTFIEMKGIGHLQNLEAPDDFDALLLNFLSLPQELLH